MRWFLTLTLAALCVGVNASPLPGVVKGRVYDKVTGDPLAGASILYRMHQGTATDANGNYFIKTSSGFITLTYQFVGYRTEMQTVYLSAADTLVINVGLQYESADIEQVVVSASRIEQKISELTVSLSLIEPKDLKTGHITDASELLNRVSGVEVLDGQASIRGGSGYSYGAGSRVLALIDGLPMISADAGDIKWYSLPLENLSQVEVIKGASSVMYGSSALNGVINFRSSDAGAKPVSQFFIESGFFGEPQRKEWIWWDSPRFFSSASFSHLQKIGDYTDFGVGGFALSDNGYRKLNEDKLGRFNVRLKHRSKKFTGFSYGLNANSAYTRKTDFILWENADFGALKQSPSTAIDMDALYVSVDPYVSFRKDGAFSHDLRMRYQSINNQFPDAANNNSDAQSVFTEYQLWYNLAKFVSINAGVLQYYSTIKSPFYGNHNGLNLAGYSQINLNPTNRLKFVGGFRLEQNSLNGVANRLVPLLRAGVNFGALDYTFVRGSFGQGYRYPSIAEKHASTTLGAVKIVPNPDVEPEKGWNAEIGVKQGLMYSNLSGMIDLALFYSQNTDLIEYVFGIYPDPITNEFGYGFRATNVEYSRVYGFELEFMINHPVGRFRNTYSGGYVYMYPIEYNPNTGLNTDVYLKFRRKHSGKININSKYNKYDFNFSLFANSKILSIDNVFLDPLTREDILPGFYDYWINHNTGHLVMDVSFGYTFTENYSISFVVKNLANTEYMGRPGDIMPHRNFSLRVSGKF